MSTDPVYKVLIAEDEPDVLAISAKRLAEAGFSVVKAEDGFEAWELFQKELPDVVVSDITMPRKDGLELLRLVKESKTKTWVPVIIISARGDIEDVRKGFDLEADHYLPKPCRMEEMVTAVRTMAALIPLRAG